MKFRDIPQFTRESSYAVDVPWDLLEHQLARYEKAAHDEGNSFELDPDFQRAHVWDETRRSRYVEFILRGGHSSKDVFWNCPGWQRTSTRRTNRRFVLVDGKQRIEAVRSFLRGDTTAFGARFADFTDRLPMMGPSFRFHINDLETDVEVYQWYIDLNAGGVAHTDEEINRVRQLMDAARSAGK